MTAFVVADVHGFYNEMIDALNAAGYDKDNPQHCFVSLGDLLDRGRQPRECLNFVNSIPDTNKILIRGNHEDLIQTCIKNGAFLRHDFHNGTVRTISDLTGIEYEECMYNQSLVCDAISKDEGLYTYLNSCINYFENNKLIFVHGWIPSDGDGWKFLYREDWREATDKEWYDSRWINGFKAWNDGVVVKNKAIWCGHWHTSWAHSKLHKDGAEWNDGGTAKFIPFEDVGIVGMDACTAYSGFVNCRKITRFKK